MSRWAIDPNLRYWKRGKREGVGNISLELVHKFTSPIRAVRGTSFVYKQCSSMF